MCLSPCKGFVTSYSPITGKPQYMRTSAKVDYVYYKDAAWRAGYYYPGTQVKVQTGERYVEEFIIMPCKQCMECRLQYSRDWASRMMLEAMYHEHSYMITLTYDEQHVPVSYYPDPDTGEAYPALSLRKSDVQDYFKRLRRRIDYHDLGGKIRYYVAGEYGERTHRPHYHAVVFGLDLTGDFEPLRKSKSGNPVYYSQLIQDTWGLGLTAVTECNWHSCAYVARYVTKKLSGDYKDFYATYNIEPEFSLQSRKPGIAREYYDEHKDQIYTTDEIFLALPEGAKKIKPVAYYDRLYDLEQPEIVAACKERRRRYAEASESQRQAQTTLSCEEQLAARKRLLDKRLQLLKRSDI